MKNLLNASDDALVQAYIEGNNHAFDILLDRYQNKLFSYIYFLVRDKDLADDVFQETFVKAIVMMQQKRYVFSGKFSSWIMRIAHNYIVDLFRQEKKMCTSAFESGDFSMNSEKSLIEDNIETVIIGQQTRETVKCMVEKLPQSQREIVYMRYYQELSFKEIADILNISINTALGRMRYALMNLRKMRQSQHTGFSSLVG